MGIGRRLALEILDSRINPAGGMASPNLTFVLPQDLQNYFGYGQMSVQDPTTGQLVGLTGAGQTIVIISENLGYANGYQGSVKLTDKGIEANPAYTNSDMYIYSTTFGLTQFGSNADEPFYLIIDGTTGRTPTNIDIGGYSSAREYALDIDSVHGLAPQTNVIHLICQKFKDSYQVLPNVFQALESYYGTINPSVFSMSYNSSAGLNMPDTKAHSEELASIMQTNFPGATLCISAGDSAAGYLNQGKGTPELYDYGYMPMGQNTNNPAILQVGGIEADKTTLNANGTGTAWGSGPNSSKHATEGTGGGYSLAYESGAFQQTHLATRTNSVPQDYFSYFQNALPPYVSVQLGLLPPAGFTPRLGPDVALQASPETGVNVIDSGAYSVEKPWAPSADGGTSLATPLMASVLAMANQGRIIRGLVTLSGATDTLPMLYRAPSSVFHDVVIGNNGYPAGPGFDLASGLGTPNQTHFLQYMSGGTLQAWVPLVGKSTASSTVSLLNTNTGTILQTLTPFPGFRGDLSVAQGDVNGDGVLDLAVGAGAGGPPQVTVYDGQSLVTGGTVVLSSFYAYAPEFTGGVSVAISQALYGEKGYVLTGAGPGAGPHVRMFHPDGTARQGLLGSFFAFAPEFLGGVTVQSGDLDADGVADIVVATTTGAGSVVAFKGQNGDLIASYLAFASGYKGGLNVSVGDVNGDGFAEVAAASAEGTNTVNVFCPRLQTQIANYYAGGNLNNLPVVPALADTEGQAVADLLFSFQGSTWTPLDPLTGLPVALSP